MSTIHSRFVAAVAISPLAHHQRFSCIPGPILQTTQMAQG